MRWLLLKDLQILRRSPLIVGLLIAYPVALGVLIGFALSADNSKPRVAFYNEVDPDEQFEVGSGEGEIDRDLARQELCDRVECVDVSSREEPSDISVALRRSPRISHALSAGGGRAAQNVARISERSPRASGRILRSPEWRASSGRWTTR